MDLATAYGSGTLPVEGSAKIGQVIRSRSESARFNSRVGDYAGVELA